jgi:hypothetical protein
MHEPDGLGVKRVIQVPVVKAGPGECALVTADGAACQAGGHHRGQAGPGFTA